MDSIAAKPKTIFSPARNVDPDAIPWIPLGDGKSFKPLRFFADDRGFTELLKIEPGTVIPLHRHTGEIHAFNLEGTRELCTGEIIGPGDYVYEPAGNIDTWKAVGYVPCIIFVTVGGAVEFLANDGTVERSISGATLRDLYREYCAANGSEMLDLVD
jgi:quercetin dioxygenase-like cupin family protein